MRPSGDSLVLRDHRGRGSRLAWRGIVCLALLSAIPVTLAAQPANDPASAVNPIIGTGTGPGSTENLFPGPSMPFGMVQLSPDTEDHGYGYHYFQHQILDFSMTHMSGVGCPNEGEVSFMPTAGSVETEAEAYLSPYSHQQESASPGYYQVQLLRSGIRVELTATERTGEAKLTFPANQQANLLIPISHTLNQSVGSSIQVIGNNTVQGYVTNLTFCNSDRTYKVFFVMHFNHPFTSYGTWTGFRDSAPAKLTADSRQATQDSVDRRAGAYLSWPESTQPQSITVSIGISYVDQNGAAANLKAEAANKTFEQIRTESTAAWKKALGVVDVTGGTQKQRTVFYTALYHSLLMPSIFNDTDGRYLGFDGQLHTVAAGHNIYDNYSGWDVYRSQMPLVALLDPQRMQDIAQSIVLMDQQGGWIDRWPQINRYTNIMAGSPLSIVLATAWRDGLHNFDMNAAWQAMYKDATQAPPPGSPYQGEVGMHWINTVHFVPDDKVSYGSVSQLQEDTLAYASLYYLAKDLGKQDAAHTLYERALYYRNLFNPQDKMFRPRNANGQWVPNFDPTKDHGFIEGSGWHYQWFAPADLAWVIQAMGKDNFNQRLTKFFSYPKPGWYGQYYNPYNETDLEAPYEFNFSGEPWMTQRAVRRVLNENYPDTPDGIPGNDDAGEMSSWAAMSMMGFYSVDPASRAYELASPVFSKVVIHLQSPYTGKTFTIESSPDPAANKYIQNVKLNGNAHTKNWIDFGDISKGGTLQITLGPSPNKQWGSSANDLPPSLSNQQP